MVAPLVAAAATAAIPEISKAMPQVLDIARQMAENADRPIYVHRWINDDGLEENLSITPRMLMMLGGASLLFAVAYAIYRWTEEQHSNWLTGGATLWDLIAGGGIGSGSFGFGMGLNSVIGGSIVTSIGGELLSGAPDVARKLVSKLKGLF